MFYLKYLAGDSKLESLTPTLKKLLEDADKKINAKQLIRILDLIDELNHNLSKISVLIFDQRGRKIEVGLEDNKIIDLSHFDQGMYSLIIMSGGNRVYTSKIVIQR